MKVRGKRVSAVTYGSIQTRENKEGPTRNIDRETDSSVRNKIPPNNLSFKNITNNTQEQKLTLKNNRASNPSFKKEFCSFQINKRK
jgi:hypothetical protein